MRATIGTHSMAGFLIRLYGSAHVMKRDVRGVLFVALTGALLLVDVFPRRSSPPVRSPLARSVELRPVSPAPLSPIDEMEQRLLDLTNNQRTGIGLRPLERETGLSAAARHHSEDMLRRAFFDHVNPDRQTPADRAKVTGQPAGAIGENIWKWSGSILPPSNDLVERAVAEWMASPAHRKNIQRPGYTHIGVGAAVSASDVRLTEMFRE